MFKLTYPTVAARLLAGKAHSIRVGTIELHTELGCACERAFALSLGLEVERALAIFGSYGGEFCPRRWLLTGLAQFGIDDAHRALDLLYARVENEWLSEGG